MTIAHGTEPKSRPSIIPWLFPLGLALVVAVNIVLLVFALRTYPGLVVGNAYERGRGYGAEIERTEAQEALRWTVAVWHESDRGRIVVRLVDADGREIPGLVVRAIADRPVGRLAEMALPLAAVGGGDYAGPFAPHIRGAWDVTVRAVDGAGHAFGATRRIVVR
jgi:nitrogen fixation protein FixH